VNYELGISKSTFSNSHIEISMHKSRLAPTTPEASLNPTEHSSHTCTATWRHTYVIFNTHINSHLTQPKDQQHKSSLSHTINSNTHLQSITKMPVPMPSTTEKSSTSASATAQTAHQVENTSTQSVASATQAQKTEHEGESEKEYEERMKEEYAERMEDEYAKREGGA
jgi:hypothetical protein